MFGRLPAMLPFAQFRFRLLPVDTLFMPPRNKGNVLRGALGTMLRRLCCHPACPGAPKCELRATCPYAVVFEPGAPPAAAALSNYEAIPRPFVIRPPLACVNGVRRVDEKTRYEPGGALEFELVLVGSAVDFLPYFVLTFERLGEEGLGLNRARCRLERVEQLGAGEPLAIFDAASRILRRPSVDAAAGPLPLASPAPHSVRIRFLTPTHLVFEEKAVREPEFHHIIRRLRDRLNALAVFYCGGPLELDFKGLGKRAEAVACVRRELQWEETERRSSRTGRRHPLAGFIGDCVFEGDLAEFLPLLEIGQFLHVGKHAAWGHGWLQVTSEARS